MTRVIFNYQCLSGSPMRDVCVVGVFLVLALHCRDPEISVIEIRHDRDLIPEGIAVYDRMLYLSSIHLNKIISTDLSTGISADLISSGQFGYLSGVGLEVHDGKLFALSCSPGAHSEYSFLHVIRLSGQQVEKQFILRDSIGHLLNDMAVSSKEVLYLTDTRSHRVYRLAYPDGEFELFLEDDRIRYPNGIALSEEHQKLFVASYATGICIIDIPSKAILNSLPDSSTIGIDGMKYDNGCLYAVQNGHIDKSAHGLVRMMLSEDHTRIVRVDSILFGHALMNIPTTFCISGDDLYLLANSQMDLLDQESNSIMHKDALTDTYVLQMKVPPCK